MLRGEKKSIANGGLPGTKQEINDTLNVRQGAATVEVII